MLHCADVTFSLKLIIIIASRVLTGTNGGDIPYFYWLKCIFA